MDMELDKKIIDIIDFNSTTFSNQGNLEFLGDDKETIENYLVAFNRSNIQDIDIENLRKILSHNLSILIRNNANTIHQTDYKKLCCLYDKLKYGW